MQLLRNSIRPWISMLLILAAVSLAGCGKSEEAGIGSAPAPARGGEVWEIDRAADRAAMPGAVLAYVHGLHVMVLGGSSAHGGMTSLKVESGPGGVRTIRLAGGLEAQLLPGDPDTMDLRFSSGESVRMKRRAI